MHLRYPPSHAFIPPHRVPPLSSGSISNLDGHTQQTDVRPRVFVTAPKKPGDEFSFASVAPHSHFGFPAILVPRPRTSAARRPGPREPLHGVNGVSPAASTPDHFVFLLSRRLSRDFRHRASVTLYGHPGGSWNVSIYLSICAFPSIHPRRFLCFLPTILGLHHNRRGDQRPPGYETPSIGCYYITSSHSLHF